MHRALGQKHMEIKHFLRHDFLLEIFLLNFESCSLRSRIDPRANITSNICFKVIDLQYPGSKYGTYHPPRTKECFVEYFLIDKRPF